MNRRTNTLASIPGRRIRKALVTLNNASGTANQTAIAQPGAGQYIRVTGIFIAGNNLVTPAGTLIHINDGAVPFLSVAVPAAATSANYSYPISVPGGVRLTLNTICGVNASATITSGDARVFVEGYIDSD